MFKKIDISELNLNPFDEISKNWLLISAKKADQINTMTASWGNLGHIWGKNVVTVYIRPQRYTKEFVDHSDYFTVTMFDGHKKELGVLGSRSGRDGDKIRDVGFHVETVDDQPTFAEGKIVFVCKKLYSDWIKPEHLIDKDCDTKWYPDKDYHEMYIAEIMAAYRNE